MRPLIKQFSDARSSITDVIGQFPKNQRGGKLFGEWSLKDILVHLTGWANFQMSTLYQLKTGKKLSTEHNPKREINDDFVRHHGDIPWSQVYQNFLTATEGLAKEYEGLPEALWNTKIWSDKETTPKEFIQLEINHYKNTHGPQMKLVLVKMKNHHE